MSCSKFHGLIVVVMVYLPLYEPCSTSDATQCTDYRLLSGVQFHAFISADILDVHCRRLQAALTCAYTRGRLKRCHLFERLPFDTQQGVVDIVCKYRREDYLKSSQCFTNNEVETHIKTTCLPALATSKSVSGDRCGTMSWVLECVKTKVLMTDGCHSADSDLMVDLVQTFIQPKSIQPHSKQPYCFNLRSKADDIKQKTVGDESSQGNSNRLSVANSTSQQPLLTEDQKIKTSFEQTDGRDNKTAKHESQGTTLKYLDDATLPLQSASWTSNDDSHKDEQPRPEITLPVNQDPTQQSQESVITPSSSVDLLPEDEWQPPAMKSTRKHSTNSEITTVEHTTTAIRSPTSTVPGSQDVDETITGSTKSTSVELESENVKQAQKNTNRSMSESNITSQVKTLKSTQGSGNDATVVHSTQPHLAMTLSSITLLVLYGK